MNFDQVSRAVLTLEHPEVAPGVPPISAVLRSTRTTKKFEVKELLLRAGAALQGFHEISS